VHFGLGVETKVQHVEIRWPSWIIQRIERPEVDKIMKIEEAVGRGSA
jgi:hypothetical protein